MLFSDIGSGCPGGAAPCSGELTGGGEAAWSKSENNKICHIVINILVGGILLKMKKYKLDSRSTIRILKLV